MGLPGSSRHTSLPRFTSKASLHANARVGARARPDEVPKRLPTPSPRPVPLCKLNARLLTED